MMAAMSDAATGGCRITVRLSPEQVERLAMLAQYLAQPRSEVIRMAVSLLDVRATTAALERPEARRIAGADDMRDDARRRAAQIENALRAERPLPIAVTRASRATTGPSSP